MNKIIPHPSAKQWATFRTAAQDPALAPNWAPDAGRKRLEQNVISLCAAVAILAKARQKPTTPTAA